MSQIIKLLIVSDFFVWTALGFVGPVLAVYFTDGIDGGTLSLTGIAVAIYWIMKSLVSMTVSWYTDREKGNTRKLTTLIIGSFCLIFIPIGFIFASHITHIIVVQALYGFAAGLTYPGWMTIFTRFLHDGHEGITWSLDSTLLNIGYALAVAISGIIAEYIGFNVLFYIVVVLNTFGFIAIISLLKYRDEILSNHNVVRYLLRKFF